MRRLVANETAGAGKKHALTSVFMTNRKIPGIPGSPLFLSPDQRSPCFIFIFFLFPHLFLRGVGCAGGTVVTSDEMEKEVGGRRDEFG